MSASDDVRRAQIEQGLVQVRARIEDACGACGRDPRSVRLVVVTKTFPASDVALLAGLGCSDVAENRDQEGRAKAADLAARPGAGGAVDGLRWHMIGQLQRNKARSVARWADVVESVDRPEIAQALSAAAAATGRTLQIMIQACLDPVPMPGRGGVLPQDAQSLADTCRHLPGLALVGVMGVAPYPGDPDQAFAALARLREDLARSDPAITQMSAGMSGDLEQAIAHGATQVRVGGAVLGNRTLLK
ncbi:MAG: YggS family pyridoxal phosphate-dependent enzyme [Actinomycetales bacterium]|nr:YggS family pyridoxal phosphate-dependent enzyme [Actinomycetales bacterium]